MVKVSDIYVAVNTDQVRNEGKHIPLSMGYSICLMSSIRLLYMSRSFSLESVASRPDDVGCGLGKDDMIVTADDQQTGLE